ncbi:MazG nucleotide pyrophosphohydrolase domain-containing protein [Sulfurovum sp.]|uniref:MazG nucleotide pyrophosphohydrolase domain-containing protein n=1 Tax=Sulfurovum sp. TaxID=1969726 RepID=UPI003562209B
MRVKHEVIRWHRKTFPRIAMDALLGKLREECLELVEAIDSKITDDIVEEMADVRIVSEAFFRFRKASSLDTETMNKLAINKKRVWGKEDDKGNRGRDRQAKD